MHLFQRLRYAYRQFGAQTGVPVILLQISCSKPMPPWTRPDPIAFENLLSDTPSP